MTDVVDTAIRSKMMSGIRGKDTKPELRIRSLLHAKGVRFRIHRKDLPGKPDLTLPKFRSVIQVHGCFWHGHSCRLFKWPQTRPDFWRQKIGRNVERDHAAIASLHSKGWRTLVIWECALRSQEFRAAPESLAIKIIEWLNETTNAAQLESPDLDRILRE